MKLSISLSAEDVAFIDEQTAVGRFDSRSAAIQAAVRSLRDCDFSGSYAAAWDEWDAAGGEVWDVALKDGLN